MSALTVVLEVEVLVCGVLYGSFKSSFDLLTVWHFLTTLVLTRSIHLDVHVLGLFGSCHGQVCGPTMRLRLGGHRLIKARLALLRL